MPGHARHPGSQARTSVRSVPTVYRLRTGPQLNCSLYVLFVISIALRYIVKPYPGGLDPSTSHSDRTAGDHRSLRGPSPPRITNTARSPKGVSPAVGPPQGRAKLSPTGFCHGPPDARPLRRPP
eukprot:1741741-Prymnesium_polylepis.1